MEIITNFVSFIEKLALLKNQNKTIGHFISSGGFHPGHISIIKKSLTENDFTIVDYANISQIGPLEGNPFPYPSDIFKDQSTLESLGVNFMLTLNPDRLRSYPADYSLSIDPNLTSIAAGINRPNMIMRIGPLAVSWLNSIRPARSYLGLKDYQQYLIVKEYVNKYIGPEVQIIGCPTIRDNDGLAFSTLNTLLSPEERKIALKLPQVISIAKKLIDNGESNIAKIKEIIIKNLCNTSGLKLEYIEILMRNSLKRTDVICKDQQIILIEALINCKKSNKPLRMMDNLFI